MYANIRGIPPIVTRALRLLALWALSTAFIFTGLQAFAQIAISPDTVTVIEETTNRFVLEIVAVFLGLLGTWLTAQLTPWIGAKKASELANQAVIVTDGMARGITRTATTMMFGKVSPEMAMDQLEAYVRTQWDETVPEHFKDRAAFRTFILSTVTEELKDRVGVDTEWLESLVSRFDPKGGKPHLPMPEVGSALRQVVGSLR
jgi:hypothetical protein